MPSLIAIRAEYGKQKPLKGARVAGCLPHSDSSKRYPSSSKPPCRAGRRSTLEDSCNIFSTQDRAAALVAAAGIGVFCLERSVYGRRRLVYRTDPVLR